MYLQKVISRKTWRSMTKIAGSGSGSISQRHGSEDPDPHQNVMDPEHWFVGLTLFPVCGAVYGFGYLYCTHVLHCPIELVCSYSLNHKEEKLIVCSSKCYVKTECEIITIKADLIYYHVKVFCFSKLCSSVLNVKYI